MCVSFIYSSIDSCINRAAAVCQALCIGLVAKASMGLPWWAGVEAPYLGEDLLTAGCKEKVKYTPEGGEEARSVTSVGQPS